MYLYVHCFVSYINSFTARAFLIHRPPPANSHPVPLATNYCEFNCGSMTTSDQCPALPQVSAALPLLWNAQRENLCAQTQQQLQNPGVTEARGEFIHPQGWERRTRNSERQKKFKEGMERQGEQSPEEVVNPAQNPQLSVLSPRRAWGSHSAAARRTHSPRSCFLSTVSSSTGRNLCWRND